MKLMVQFFRYLKLAKEAATSLYFGDKHEALRGLWG